MTTEEFYAKHSKITRSLKKFVSDQETSFSAEVFSRFLNVLSEEIERIRILIFQAPAGTERAAYIHRMVDAEIESEKNIAGSCVRGCSHCCHLEVEVTSDEALILKDILQEGFPADLERLRSQSKRQLQDPLWNARHFKKENRCVFLSGDGACQIYEARPVMCRRHSVTSPPSECASEDGVISVRYFPRVDVIISAANEDPELRVGPLAKLILSEV